MEFLALAFGLGLILGSFYTVCVHRYIEGQSIVWPGSRCPACGHGLRWYENIPLVSWLIQGGRCRACKAPISARYPVMELTSGLWSLALAWKFGPTAPYIVYMVFGGALIVASFIDFELYILPDVITLTGSVLALAAAPLLLGLPWTQSAVGALAGGGFFLALHLFYKHVRGIDGLGMGDVKLMVLLGGLLGPLGLPVIVLTASITGLVAGVGYMLARRDGQGMKTMIPFGPFLSLGGMVAMLFRDDLIRLAMLAR